ncbi:MAG: hypothetical protein CMF72_24620 [Mameliella sp.]|nr:hypothetical protein [Mameliella sp.]|tara:strand:+ start:56 stop:406 length:351 start_codon:yes stop_codon:yes gene_type:complete
MHLDFTSDPNPPKASAEHSNDDPDTESCDASSPNGFACTRDTGHDGRHEAAGGDTLCAVWTDEAAPDTAPARPVLNLEEVLTWHGHDIGTAASVLIEPRPNSGGGYVLTVTHRLNH